jgi:hypothetical protein
VWRSWVRRGARARAHEQRGAHRSGPAGAALFLRPAARRTRALGARAVPLTLALPPSLAREPWPPPSPSGAQTGAICSGARSGGRMERGSARQGRRRGGRERERERRAEGAVIFWVLCCDAPLFPPAARPSSNAAPDPGTARTSRARSICGRVERGLRWCGRRQERETRRRCPASLLSLSLPLPLHPHTPKPGLRDRAGEAQTTKPRRLAGPAPSCAARGCTNPGRQAEARARAWKRQRKVPPPLSSFPTATHDGTP